MDGRCIFNLEENSIIKPYKAIKRNEVVMKYTFGFQSTVTVNLQYTVYNGYLWYCQSGHRLVGHTSFS